jgi:hypothetical protein
LRVALGGLFCQHHVELAHPLLEPPAHLLRLVADQEEEPHQHERHCHRARGGNGGKFGSPETGKPLTHAVG